MVFVGSCRYCDVVYWVVLGVLSRSKKGKEKKKREKENRRTGVNNLFETEDTTTSYPRQIFICPSNNCI